MSKPGAHRSNFDREKVLLTKSGVMLARAGKGLSSEFLRNPVEYQRKLRGIKYEQ